MIRKMINNKNEIDVVMKIWLESTIKAHDFITDEYWNESYDTVKNIYIPQSETYVYIEDGKILGFIAILNNDYIGALFIERDSQGKGIGRKLIDYVRAKYKKLSLSVYKKNEYAVEFYKSNGFEIVSEQPNEETNKLEYIMVLNC